MTKEKVIEIIDTRITDHWGVYWNEMETVRDFLQNFYDANKIEDIKIEIKETEVSVSAPAVFDYKELIYFGSDKRYDQESIGTYGEGFKASILNALRNYNCKIEMLIGHEKLIFYFENKKIGKTEKRNVLCKRVVNSKPLKGSELIIKNCPSNLITEFKFGLNCFYYKTNPLFGDLLEETGEQDISVYKSINNEGYVFYKKLLRAKIDVPLVIVCNRNYKRVEDKISHDRDRKAFTKEVTQILLKLMFRPLSVKNILFFLQPFWGKGHKILSLISDSVRWNYNLQFPENYYAKNRKINATETDLLNESEIVEKEFKTKGYICCPHYMHRLGMKTPESVAQEKREKIKTKYTSTYSRDLTEKENDALKILVNFVRTIHPYLIEQFQTAEYTVGESDEVIGELIKKRGWHEKKVFLSKHVFLFDFSEALSVLLHEWGHIYGYDGSRSFTDILTEFIALILKNINDIKSFEKKWKNIIKMIQKERSINNTDDSILERINNLSSHEKTKMLKSIPNDELFKLLKKNDLD